MRHLELTFMAAIFGLFALLAPGFYDVCMFVGAPPAYGAMPEEMKKAWLVEITEFLGCHCGCDLTLKECEQDDPNCELRPVLMQKLPATMELEGPSLVRLGGCSCGCGYTLAECEEKHRDCTQRPRIHQQLKRLAVKYGYEKIFVRSSGLGISSAERKIFSGALKGYTVILYVHEEKKGNKSRYLKTLLKFQKTHKERLTLIPISLADKEEKDLITYYQIEKPSVVMVAPSGAVTALFKEEPPVEKLKRGLVSPKMGEILLAIQQGMTTFLCVGRPNDIDFEKAKQIVLPAVHKLGGIATAIWLDPTDPSEKPLLSALRYKDNANGAPVFVIAPTGLLIEKIESGLTERRLFDSFQRILAMRSGCGQSTITGGSACQPGYGVTGESSCQ
jgi:hypothetical protein